MPIDASAVKWDAPHPAEVVWDNEPKPAPEPLHGKERATEDVTNVGSGLVSGATALPRLGHALGERLNSSDSMLRFLPGAVEGRLVTNLEDAARAYIPGVKTIEDKISSFADRPSQTPEGKYIKSVSEQVPTTLLGPGATTYKVASALGSGATGQAAADLTHNNPVARLAGTVLGGLGGALGIGKAAPWLKTTRALSEAEKSDQALIDAGYKLPPAQARPTQLNKLLEGIGGKYRTQQEMSAPNKEVTNDLVRKEFGLPKDAPITKQTLENVRKRAGQAYEDIKNIPQPMRADKDFADDLKRLSDEADKVNAEFGTPSKKAIDDTKIKEVQNQFSGKAEFSARGTMDYIKRLREEASTLGQKYGDVEAKAERALKLDTANALESLIERNLHDLQYPGLDQFRAARQLIAKTHDVEEALSPNFNVEEKKVFQTGQKKDLSGNLATIASMGGRYPKATQDVSSFGGTPSLNAVDMAGMLGSGKPEAMGLPLVGGLTRALQRSGPYQRTFVRPSDVTTLPNEGALQRVLTNPGLLGLINNPDENQSNGN